MDCSLHALTIIDRTEIVLTLQTNDDWNLEIQCIRGSDDALGDDITAHNATEDIDENHLSVFLKTSNSLTRMFVACS